MRVTMIGAGYVGLVSGACFADFGHQVTVIDNDARRIAALQRGEIPILFRIVLPRAWASLIKSGGRA
jgi:UDP-glucose 6-dehydrogenase